MLLARTVKDAIADYTQAEQIRYREVCRVVEHIDAASVRHHRECVSGPFSECQRCGGGAVVGALFNWLQGPDAALAEIEIGYSVLGESKE